MVGQAVIVGGYGCEDEAGQAVPTAQRTERHLRFGLSTALPKSALVHEGSQFTGNPTAVDDAAASNVVTAGPGTDPARPGLCSGDSGGPLYRAGPARIIVGINANYTFSPNTPDHPTFPVTNLHTRLDDQSRFAVGPWLARLGARTTRTY
jgi:hypothetical protein